MSKRKTLLTGLACALLAATGAQASWLHLTTSVFKAETQRQKHPARLTQTLVMPEDAVNPMVCAAYGNNFKRKNAGKLLANVHVSRKLATIDSFDLSGRVQKNSAVVCRPGPNLEKGDVLVFEFELRSLPRLKILRKRTDYFGVHGVVSTGGAPSAADLAQPAPAKGGWLHFANSRLEAERHGQQHPGDLIETVVVPRDAVAPLVCTGYRNTSASGDQGRVFARVSIARSLFDLDQLKFEGDVTDNAYLECIPVDDLKAGTIVLFEFEFEGLPSLEMSGARIDRARARGLVSTAGKPVSVTPEPPDEEPPPPDPTPPPDPPPPDPTPPPPPPDPDPPPSPGGLSAADQRAVSSLLVKTRKTQLWRPNKNNPTKWVVVGPRTRAISGNKLDPKTAGYGHTIAVALTDYERKQGKLAAGDLLTADQRKAIEWFSKMDASQGPTALRKSNAGPFYADYWRPGTGSRLGGPFGRMAQAVDWMKAQGL